MVLHLFDIALEDLYHHEPGLSKKQKSHYFFKPLITTLIRHRTSLDSED